MTSAGLVFTAHSFNAICRSIEMQKGKTVFKLWSESSHRARRNIPKADVEGRTRCATRSQQRHPGERCPSQRRIFFFFFLSSLRELEPPSLSAAGAGAVRITSRPLAVFQIVWSTTVQAIAKGRPTRVLADGGRWRMGAGINCRMPSRTTVQGAGWHRRPTARSFDATSRWHACKSNSARPGRGTASSNTSRLCMRACSASSTSNESRAWGPRRLRAQT